MINKSDQYYSDLSRKYLDKLDAEASIGENLETCEFCHKQYCKNCNFPDECQEDNCSNIISCINCKDENNQYSTCPRCNKLLCRNHIWNHCLP